MTRWIPVLTLFSATLGCDSPTAECDAVDRAEPTPEEVGIAAAKAAIAEAAAEAEAEAAEAPPAGAPCGHQGPLPKALADVPVDAPASTKAKVVGELSPDIIRRIVRAHINEIRHCYNQGLTIDPELGGRVAIAFTIAESGDVKATSIAESTLESDTVASCMEAAVARWKFPRPDGGEVQVTYPFVLEPG